MFNSNARRCYLLDSMSSPLLCATKEIKEMTTAEEISILSWEHISQQMSASWGEDRKEWKVKVLF